MADRAHSLNNRPSTQYWIRQFPIVLDLLTALILLVVLQSVIETLHGRTQPVIPPGIGSFAVAVLSIAMLIIAGALAAGVVAEQMRCAWSARIVRGMALLAASLFFGFTDLWFGVISNAALGGASYLFIAARCAMAAFAHLVDWTAIVRDP